MKTHSKNTEEAIFLSKFISIPILFFAALQFLYSSINNQSPISPIDQSTLFYLLPIIALPVVWSTVSIAVSSPDHFSYSKAASSIFSKILQYLHKVLNLVSRIALYTILPTLIVFSFTSFETSHASISPMWKLLHVLLALPIIATQLLKKRHEIHTRSPSGDLSKFLIGAVVGNIVLSVFTIILGYLAFLFILANLSVF